MVVKIRNCEFLKWKGRNESFRLYTDENENHFRDLNLEL